MPRPRHRERTAMNNPTVSFILVNYKTPQITLKSIEHIKQNIHSVPYEIIVVDNASKDDSLKNISRHHPDLGLLSLEKNMGFGVAANRGAAVAKGPFLCFLNSDIFLIEDCIHELIQFYGSHHVGALGIRLLNGENRFLPSYGHFPDPLLISTGNISFLRRLKCKCFNRYATVDPARKEPLEVDWITGAVFFISRERFRETGGFDETFFLYYEDTDLCLRLRRAGYHNYYIPQFHAVHLHGASGKHDMADGYNRIKLSEKMSATNYVRKHFPQRLGIFILAMRSLYLMEIFTFWLKTGLFWFAGGRRQKTIFKMRTALMIWRSLRNPGKQPPVS